MDENSRSTWSCIVEVRNIKSYFQNSPNRSNEPFKYILRAHGHVSQQPVFKPIIHKVQIYWFQWLCKPFQLSICSEPIPDLSNFYRSPNQLFGPLLRPSIARLRTKRSSNLWSEVWPQSNLSSRSAKRRRTQTSWRPPPTTKDRTKKKRKIRIMRKSFRAFQG